MQTSMFVDDTQTLRLVVGNPVQSIYDSELLYTRETVLASAVVVCGRHHISNTINLHEERHASALSTLNQFDGYDSRVNKKRTSLAV